MGDTSYTSRFLPTLLATSLVVVLAACSNSSGDGNEGGQPPPVADSTEETSSTAGEAAGPITEAQAGVDHFLQSLVASAPPENPNGPEAQAAWDHLPKSRQAKLSEGNTSTLYTKITAFLGLSIPPGKTLTAELNEYDELLRTAIFRIYIVGTDPLIERIISVKKTVCDQGFATAGSVTKDTVRKCEEANVRPWKITRVHKLN